MGILDNMAQQANAQPQMQQTATLPQTEQTGNMMQMYQFLMQNSMQAIAETAEQRIHEKGPVDGTADLIATAMVSNLQAAQQNGKTIPHKSCYRSPKILPCSYYNKWAYRKSNLMMY